jgi:two-component system, chemotaxis family, sensor kinase CheA
MDDFELELKADFLNEAKDLVASTEASFLELEKHPENENLLDSIFRLAHSLKGTSRAVGFGQMAELTHVAENVLLKLKKKELLVTEAVVNVLLVFNDEIGKMIAGLQEDIGSQFDHVKILADLHSLEQGIDLSSPSAPEAIVAAKVEDLEIESTNSLAPDSSLFVEDEVSVVVQPAPVERPAPAVTKSTVKKEKDEETIRVSLERIEKLGDSIGELVILQSFVERALSHSPEDMKTARALSKLSKDIQELSMSIRMVPLATTFQKLQRTVRDTSRALNKKIDLRILGEETEIDRTVLEHLGDPLVHLIRNAIDHGVETPEDRIQIGKSPEGVVEVMACHEGNFLVIQITDDGKGMDPQKLCLKAQEKGILKPGQSLSEQDALNLIFHPGFSTKEVVSEVSGRGVGMDVVKTNIEALGGEIKIRSKFGVGSCFRLQLPLTLAIIDGMLVSCGDQTFIIPRNQVHEINRFDESAIHYASEKVPFYQLRDEVLPLFRLSAETGSKSVDSKIILVIRLTGMPYAVALDDVIGQQQVVVKPPTLEIIGKKGMMGTTILGDGKPALILDLVDLYSRRSKTTQSVQKVS